VVEAEEFGPLGAEQARTALERILFVDDDPEQCELTALVLAELGGFRVEACRGLDEATRAAQDFRPDLLLLDLDLGDASGPEVLAAVRKLPGLDRVPAVFLTGWRSVPSLVQDQALAVLTKPVGPAELCDRLTAAWAEHRNR